MAGGAYNDTINVTDTEEVELKPARGKKRDYLFIQNASLFDVYINNDTHASATQGTTLGAGLFYERGAGGGNVPRGTVRVRGSQATPQQVNVEQGYAD